MSIPGHFRSFAKYGLTFGLCLGMALTAIAEKVHLPANEQPRQQKAKSEAAAAASTAAQQVAPAQSKAQTVPAAAAPAVSTQRPAGARTGTQPIGQGISKPPAAIGSKTAAPAATAPQQPAEMATAPQQPLRPEQMPSGAPRISYSDGKLTVIAENSTMADVLAGIRSSTGIKIETVGGPSSERV